MQSVTGLALARVGVADAAVARPAVFMIHQGLTVFSLEVCHIILVLTSALTYCFLKAQSVFFLLVFKKNVFVQFDRDRILSSNWRLV